MHELDPVLVGQVGLGDGDNAPRNAQEIDDGEVLARLRHNAVIGGDHQEHDIDAGRARHHLAHELLMTRYVDDAHTAPAGQIELRESKLDRDAAGLFLGEAIGIGAGERLDERRLTVIDMTGGSQYERRHALTLPRGSRRYDRSRGSPRQAGAFACRTGGDRP